MNTKTIFAAIALLAVLLGQFFPAQETASAAGCDAALFVADVTVPDGSAYSPNAAFTKTWRLKNVGTCTWTTSYKLVFASGEHMGGPAEVNLAATVAPNQTVDLSVNLTAPVPAGSYKGFWQLKNAAGALFGIGSTADKAFWVAIVTRPGSAVTPVPVGESYNFASSGDKAQSWMSGAGILPFPGADGDARGFALKLDSVKLETGTTVNQPTLLTVPQNKTDGYVQGLFPSLAIQSGDRLQTTVGCQFGASACFVTYRIDYRTNEGTKTLWTFKEKYDGLTFNLDKDLSFLAGKNVEFFLLVLASGSAVGDRALWVNPHIVRTGSGPVPTVVPSNWLTYTNQQYQFQFRYPPEGQIGGQTDAIARISLPIVPGTNLGEKYLDVSAAQNATTCSSALTSGHAPGSFTSVPVSFNGISFIKESGSDAGVGNLWQWTAYSTLKGNTCVSLGFVLHSMNPDNSQTPPPVFDKNAESAVFEQIMSTFAFLGSPPTATVTPGGPTNTPPLSSGCDRATFIADVNVPDGTVFAPNTAFTKTWRLKNTGTCTWTTAYKLVFASGPQMGGPAETNLTTTVAPNQTVDLSVNLTAPATAGSYRGFWQLKNAAGALFGIGSGGNMPFWVDIVVSGGGGTTPIPTSAATGTPIASGSGYDFAANAGSAAWRSGAGVLPFPGTDGDARGFALKLDSVKLETGSTVNQPTLLTVPQNKTDGYVQGLYPALTVQSGDRFQTTVGCQFGATACFVNYRVDYRTSTGTKTLWSFKEKYDGQTFNVDLDLSFLAGKNVEFFLLMLASGSATGDRALWIAPRLVHTGGTSPTATPTPLHGNWLTYTNTRYQFKFQYPPDGQLSNAQDNSVHIALPFAPGTNLGEKYLDMAVVEGASTCSSLPTGLPASTSQQVTINGIVFTKETGTDQGAGQIRQWTNYFTVRGNACVSMGFVLHSGNIGNFPTGTPEFNFEAESAVFGEMMSTFAFLSTGSTGSYAVVGVTDTLNVRSRAGATNPLVAALAYNANNIARTGASSTVSGAEWWQISIPAGGTGWVNAFYLTEYVPPTIFCADAKVTTLLTNLGDTLKNSNGAALAALVSPRHGVDIRLASFVTPKTINFSKAGAAGIFTNTTAYKWGSAPCSDQIPGSTFNGEVRPKMLEVYNSPDLQLSCNDLTKVGSVAQPWPAEYANINFYSLHKPGTPGIEDDWRTLLVGTEFVNGQPYAFALYNYQWSC